VLLQPGRVPNGDRHAAGRPQLGEHEADAHAGSLVTRAGGYGVASMDVQSLSTLLAAWVLAPLLTVIAAGGLGLGVAALTRYRLGALTLPLGYAAGIVLIVVVLEIGLGGAATIAVTGVAALAGYAAHWTTLKELLARRRVSALRQSLPAAAAAAGGFLLAMAPLVGSGRAGVLGYILNDDSVGHAGLIELFRADGLQRDGYDPESSWTEVGEIIELGYPLGSHAWPLFSGGLSSLDSFYVWTPSVAIAAAMLALVAFAALRRLSAPAWPAALAAALVPAGYLTFSYIVQGSIKEVMTAVTVYGAIVVAAEVFDRGLSVRGAALLAIAPAAAFLTFGAGAAVWLAAPTLVFLVIAVRRVERLRATPRAAFASLLVLGLAAAVMVPAVSEALGYVRDAEAALTDASRPGNLVGAVPWEQAFNIWFAYDYRVSPATYEGLSTAGPWLGAALAAVGVGFAVHRRELALPLMVASGVLAAVVISLRYTIYLEAKGYALLAPALAIAAAAAVFGLLARPGAARVIGAVGGVLLAEAVLAGAALVYAGAWVTPKDRFDEIADIADRFDGQGPILIVEREEWGTYLLRDLEPFDSWGYYPPDRVLRTDGRWAPGIPHTPDFDDYYAEFVERFPLLFERKSPGGSRPPANFRVAYETAHYRVWQRHAQAQPLFRIPLGSDSADHTARLDCGRPDVREALNAIRRSDRSLVAAIPRSRPLVIMRAGRWRGSEVAETIAPSGFVSRRGGVAAVTASLRPGHYDAWIQGSFGTGVRLVVDGTAYGEVFGDLGVPSGWHPLGRVAVRARRADVMLLSLTKPWWQSGSKRPDLTGRLVFVRRSGPSRTIKVPPERARTLCGRRLDWIELPD
jgi:hypothetical protein